MRQKYDMDKEKVALETVAQQNRGVLSSDSEQQTHTHKL